VTAAARVEGLSHAFGEVQAVKGVTLELLPREILGIVGPDAAGKSTLLRLWVPVMRARAGKVEIDGLDAVADPEKVRGLVGYMPQRFSLYEDLTVDENIRFFSELRLVPRAEFAKRREELLAFTRLDRFTTRRAGKLSGGMKQKLGLICTLMHRPKVLFLDEPTNGVDPVSRREFWDLLRALSSGRGDLAIAVSTPYMDEAERCHRVAIMDRGEVRASGSPDELRSKVGGEVIEVITPRPAAAREPVARAALGERASDPTAVAMSGGRLRVRASAPGAQEAVRRALAAERIEADVTVVPPSMEDVFVALSSEKEKRA
jgi:ABC-2 type transport system ATP-binding protein